YINNPNWDRHTICYSDDDDNEDYTTAVTPILSTKEPDNSLSMGNEHLDTILTMKSDEFIKSSVKNLVPIPSESEGIPDNMCDVPFHDNSPPLDIMKLSMRIMLKRLVVAVPLLISILLFMIRLSLINPFPPADRSDFYEFADELAHIITPPEYDCFCFKNEPNSKDFTIDVV
nr:hypothetical protein [Tanacetum cinerariifolium]